MQQKKPVPASPGADSPMPDAPMPGPGSATASDSRIAFELESRAGGDSKVFVVRLASRAAGLGPGPSGTRGGAA